MGSGQETAVNCFGGAGLFFGLAILFTVIALIPKWRRKWQWGRQRYIPISGRGFIGIILCFSLMASAFMIKALGIKLDDFFIFLLIMGGFIVFVVSGLLDSIKNERKQD